jgi:hypothetical protein
MHTGPAHRSHLLVPVIRVRRAVWPGRLTATSCARWPKTDMFLADSVWFAFDWQGRLCQGQW